MLRSAFRLRHASTVPARKRVAAQHARPLSSTAFFHPVETLSQAYLDFGTALQSLPLPEFLPPHAAAIIISTIVLRSAVTLPVTLWSRARVRRFKEIVIPQTKEAERQYGRELKLESQRTGKKIDEAAFEKFKVDTGPKLKALRAELVKKYRCSPLPTFIVPAAVHIPVFILASLSLRAASLPPTPLLLQSFISEASLAQTDTFGVFPVAIGLTTLVNFEVSRRYFAAIRERHRWEEVLDNALRGVSVVMMGAAMMAPNSVTLYWVTSSAFTLGQTVWLGMVDKHHEAANTATPPQAVQPSSAAAPAPRQTPPASRTPKIVIAGQRRRR